MKKTVGLSLGLCLLFIGLGTLAAQETSSGITPPPKVLVIVREFLKPGRAGSMHQKTESAFVNAFTAAKWPTHYFAMDSLSGAPRSLFFVGYNSFEAWQKDNDATNNNPTLSAALDRASIADGDLLTGYESSTFTFREDLSLRAGVDIAHMRFFDISRFVVRPGHQKEFDDLAKMYISAYEKVSPEAHWATFESMYGVDNGGVFLVITPLKSLAETDKALGEGKQFMAALGEDGMKKLGELTAASVEASQTNIFQINPRISYPVDEWVKANPSFWKPKPAAPAKKPETKPEQ
jgi:hypothetical protein